MNDNKRILFGFIILVILAGGLLGIDFLRRRAAQPVLEGIEEELPPGSIPISWNGTTSAYFTPDDLSELTLVSFVDDEEGKTQEGWMLRDVVLLVLGETALDDSCTLTVASSSRDKTVELSWAEVRDEANMVMFDLSGRGTLKLVSLLERLDIRDEWVQDVDSVDVVCP